MRLEIEILLEYSDERLLVVSGVPGGPVDMIDLHVRTREEVEMVIGMLFRATRRQAIERLNGVLP